MAHLRRFAGALATSLPGRVILKYGEDRGSLHAIVIAWSLLFSIFPLALVTAGALGLVLRNVSPTEVYSRVIVLFPDPQSQAAALQALAGFRTQTGLFLIIGLGGLVWSASLLFGAMDEIFAFIYHVRPREFLQQRLMSLVMMLVYIVLTAIAIGTSAIVTLLPVIPGAPQIGHATLALAGQVVVGVLTGIVLFGAIYTVVPNLPMRPLRALPGAVVAGVAFEALALLFPVFLRLNRGLSQYGQTFTLLFVLLTFFYFIGVITVIGVEINSVLRAVPVKRGSRASAPSPEAGQAPAGDARPAPWTGVAIRSEQGQRRRGRSARSSRP